MVEESVLAPDLLGGDCNGSGLVTAFRVLVWAIALDAEFFTGLNFGGCAD